MKTKVMLSDQSILIKYTIYNALDYSVLSVLCNNTVDPDICEGWHFSHTESILLTTLGVFGQCN